MRRFAITFGKEVHIFCSCIVLRFQAVEFVNGIDLELKVSGKVIDANLCVGCRDFILREIPGACLQAIVQTKVDDPDLANGMDETLEEGTTSLARRESELFVISMHSIPDAEAGTGTSLWL